MNALFQFLKRHGRPVFIGGLIGLISAFLLGSGVLGSWSSRVADRLFISRPVDSRIAIIAIDDASITAIGRWPWNRNVHAELIGKLNEAGVSVIAYDVNFSEASNGSDDADLASAITASKKVILPTELTIVQSEHGLNADPNLTVSPLPLFERSAIGTGFSNTPPDADGVVRSMPLRVLVGGEKRERYPFSLEAALALDPSASFAEAPLDEWGRVLISYPGSPGASYPIYSAEDVLNGRIGSDQLRGRLVFVGSTAADLHDEQFVPTSFDVPMSGVEIHAAFADTVLGRHWIHTLPSWAYFFLFALIGFLIGWIISAIKTRWSIAIIFGFWVLLLVASVFLFEYGWLINILWLSLMMAIAMGGVMIERRVASEHERRVLRELFEHYVSPSVVETIVRNPTKLKLGGERRRMTVLFSDIRVFTTLTETMDAEMLIQLLNLFFNRMTEEIFRTKGVLDKFMGDGIMAFWNAPFDQPDHALLTVESALAMQHVLDQMNKEGTFGNPPWQMGVGINTGEMIVGNIGGVKHADYTVIGDAVNLASRIEGLTREYHVPIIASETTAKEVGDHILLRRLDRVVVKGRFQSVTIYEVICETSQATAAQKELVSMYEKMLDFYCVRNFDEVIYHAQQILMKYPNDGPTLLIRNRARDFLSSPPPAGWDGTWVFTEK